ncbi:pseudouridine synthase [Hydrogenophaga defluvii]|uniref:Dual-specificity RNA pseudouridine synthase RluF n=1 Tax=Hydrogenophaga defluvii TaxID=249410 RepID=A0ABW2SE07_9BURK
MSEPKPPSPPERKRLSLSKPAAKAAPPARRGGAAGRPSDRPPAGQYPAPAPRPTGGIRSTLQSQAQQRAPAPVSATREAGLIRLNKRMADLGLCSRREADEWIARGWVKVNGQPADMGQPVAPDCQVEVLPQAQHQQEARVTILLHKPVGYVSGLPEDGHESAAVLISPRSHWADDRSPRRFEAWHTRGLAPAGRLDIDSTGLLVMTQDGRVARTLIGEDSGIEKEYLVRVHYIGDGPDAHPNAPLVTQNVQAALPPAQLARLRHGLSLDGQPLKPAQVDWQNPEQLRFVLTEGKKRQIRRMCEQVGLHVVGLKRIRIGKVVLGNLPVGQWRYLGATERF